MSDLGTCTTSPLSRTGEMRVRSDLETVGVEPPPGPVGTGRCVDCDGTSHELGVGHHPYRDPWHRPPSVVQRDPGRRSGRFFFVLDGGKDGNPTSFKKVV